MKVKLLYSCLCSLDCKNVSRSHQVQQLATVATLLTTTGTHVPYEITSVTCYPTEVTIPPLPSQSCYSIQRHRRDAKLSWPGSLVKKSRLYIHLQMVTHPSTNRVQFRVTLFMHQTTLTTMQSHQQEWNDAHLLIFKAQNDHIINSCTIITCPSSLVNL